jgi:hypothetical protein
MSMQKSLEDRARRAAKKVGLVARKSRKDHPDNHGGFMLINPAIGFEVAGFKFDLDPEEVIEYCSDD